MIQKMFGIWDSILRHKHQQQTYMVFNGTPRAKDLPQILFNDATGASLPGAFSSQKILCTKYRKRGPDHQKQQNQGMPSK